MVTNAPPPQPVRIAVIGIVVLAALAYLSVVWAVYSPRFRAQLDDMLSASAGGTPSSAWMDSARTTVLVVMLVASATWALMTAWLALKTRRGGRWARVLVTVIVTIPLLDAVRMQFQAGVTNYPLWIHLLSMLEVLVRVAVLVLLWSPEESRLYFRRRIPTVGAVNIWPIPPHARRGLAQQGQQEAQ